MKNIKILFIIALLTISSACKKDFLTLTPTATVSDDKAFATPEAAKGVIIAIYNQLSNWRMNVLAATATNEVRGDDMFVTQFNHWTWFITQFHFSNTPDDKDERYHYGLWREYYETIRMCNAFLSAKLPFKDATKNKLIAEVKTIQAYAYFNLVQFFCIPYTADNGTSPGVPLRITTDVSLPMGRGTVNETYQFIIDNLVFATQHLNPLEKNAGGDIYVTKCFANGLLARVYMTMGKFSEAIPFIDAAIADAPTLATGAEYTKGFSLNNTECIFRIGFTSKTDFQYSTLQSFNDYGWGDAGGYGTLCVYDEFYTNYATNDLRQDFFWWKAAYSWGDLRNKIAAKGDKRAYAVPFKFSEKGDIVYVKEGRQLYGKFPRKDDSKNSNNPDSGEVGFADFTVMRTSELYLIKAECEARKTAANYTAAVDALFEIQNRCIPNAIKSTKSGQDLIEEIWMERRKELIGEGFRMFDLLRNGLPLVRPSSTWSGITNLPAYSPKFLQPIPQAEIDANKGLTNADQNEAYK
jgi:hypothetical protein